MSILNSILFLIISFFHPSFQIIGYDCGSQVLNMTTISLLEVGPCDIPMPKATTEDLEIQVLQMVDFAQIPVIQCKIEIYREVRKCGIFSHMIPVENSIQNFIYEIERDACQQLHTTGIIRLLGTHAISGVKVNATQTYSQDFAGRVVDGSCYPAPYADHYGSWTDVLVQGYVRITLTEYWADVNLNNDQLHLTSGTKCKVTDSKCLDMEGGNTFWSPLPQDRCNTDKYSLLYEGKAAKITDRTMPEVQTMYSVESKEMTFALTVKGYENHCGHVFVKSSHPKLMIIETRGMRTPFTGKFTTVKNMDLFLYVNSKFVYVERHIKKQITQLYLDVVTQRCNLERETIKNSLAIAVESPDQFAYNLMPRLHRDCKRGSSLFITLFSR